MKFIIVKPEIIVENRVTPVVPTQLDELEAISTSVDNNLAKDVNIPKDVLDSFQLKDELNPEIWPNGKLDPEIQVKLIKIANGFLKDLNLGKGYKIKDIIFTGSLANYNWSKYSDIDLHIVLDYKQFNGEPEMIEDYFWGQKALWTNEHDIKIKNYPVEIYAQDSNQKLNATAIYSVLKNKWILKPSRENFKLDKNVIKTRAQNYIEQLKSIRDEYNDKHFNTVVNLSTKLKDKITQMRKAGLERGGEFSLENLVFKVLRRTPFMDVLSSYKIKAYDNMMSVKEIETLDEGKVLNNTKFEFQKEEPNGLRINAMYEGQCIASLNFTVVKNNGPIRFANSISKDDYVKLFPEPKFININYIKVYFKEFRGEHIAKKMMEMTIEKARQLGINTISLHASPSGMSLDELIGFYESLGFKVFLHKGDTADMILHINSEKTLTEEDNKLIGGVLFIKGEQLENGEQRLYATTIKGIMSLNRKKTDNSEGQGARMAVIGNNKVFRIGLDSNKLKAFTVAWNNEKTMLGKLGLSKSSVALNNNKTPFHWLSTQTNNVAQAVNELGYQLQNIPNIRWVG